MSDAKMISKMGYYNALEDSDFVTVKRHKSDIYNSYHKYNFYNFRWQAEFENVRCEFKSEMDHFESNCQ